MNHDLHIFCAEASKIIQIDGKSIRTHILSVIDEKRNFVNRFRLMCAAIEDEIKTIQDAIRIIQWVCEVEKNEIVSIDAGGNAWVIEIKNFGVYFEGFYGQGEGGEVSLSQFKLALQIYLQFLNDPERKTVKFEFPEN
jgi:hypothetical protein